MNPLYFRKSIFLVALLGFSSGLPISYTASTLSAILTERDVDLKSLGLLSLVGLPYLFKFLWAPLFDAFSLPFIKGRRKGWIITLQILLIICLNLLGYATRDFGNEMVVVVAILIAILSASQDVVVDAFRIENLKDEEQAAGAAATQLGYRIAMLLVGGFGFILAHHFGWQASIACISYTLIPCIVALFFAKEKPYKSNPSLSLFENLQSKVIGPYKQFTSRKDDWIYILLFIIVYKMSDAFALSLTTPFYLQIGFTKEEIGTVVKIYGVMATIAGTLFGGLLAKNLGLRKVLNIGIVIQCLSNFIYIWQYDAGNSVPALIFTVSVENFAGGIGSTALVAYMSLVCHKSFTATQYALLSAFAGLTRVFVAAISGYVVEDLGWDIFFLISVVLSLPALAIMYYKDIGIPNAKKEPATA